jgi:uncharacterized protein YjbI with pentapeptide repeats
VTTLDHTGSDLELSADCSRCFALCCVVPAFSRSADFAIDKPARQPCPNLEPDFGCGIHTQLRPRGFAGCTTYDCFGAGQQVAQVTFGGHDWRDTPDTAAAMFDVFPVMRALHELLWYLTEAASLPAAAPLADDLRIAVEDIRRLTRATPAVLRNLDMESVRDAANRLLSSVSDTVRAAAPGPRSDRRRADLIAAKLAGADLRGANLRGAYLIGADLRDADLGFADVTGADLRSADVRGADLSTTIFLLQSQLDSARGDRTTRMPPNRVRPAHWTGT